MLRLNHVRILLAPALLICLACWANPLWADITLPKIFSDHMVLQRNSSVTLWGKAKPDQKLVITFNKQKLTSTADPQGHWSAKIKTADAGGPYQLGVADETGEPKVVFSDVMVGEVWLCSGQSNMEWPMSKSLNADVEIEKSNDYPNLRLFTVGRKASPQPLDDFAEATPWQCCSSESVSDFSAVAYFFGQEISKQLDGIPIGLIDASWGGTPAESWTSKPSLSKVESLAPLLDHWKNIDDPTNPDRPSTLYNGMIAPLTPFQFRGTIWYQGESNNGRGHQYATLLPTLIQDWRISFHAPEMPFYFVQIAPYRYKNRSETGLAEIWDAQLKTLRSVPHTGMAVTTDIGDINDIHPKNKKPVGHRLARLALSDIYRDQLPKDSPEIVPSGPLFDFLIVRKHIVRVGFRHTGDGLKKRDPDLPLSHFEICGQDKQFVPANAKIKGKMIKVWSDAVKEPTAVRFGWSDTAVPNLINSAGLPASPFRTDNFPLESVDEHF